MPPVKVKIEKIESQRVRQHTFQKRKTGLIKKAIELTILCDCDVSIIINKRHTSSNARSARLVAYSNRNIQDMIAECWDDLEKCAQVTNAVYPKASSKASEENDAKPAKEGENSDDDEGGGEGDDIDMQLQNADGRVQGATIVKEESKAPPVVSASRAEINRKIALTMQHDKVAMPGVDSNNTMPQAQIALDMNEVNKPVPQQVQMQGRLHCEMQQGGGGYFQEQQQKMKLQHQQMQVGLNTLPLLCWCLFFTREQISRLKCDALREEVRHSFPPPYSQYSPCTFPDSSNPDDAMQVQHMQQAQGQGQTHMQQLFVKPMMQHGSYPQHAHVENSLQPVTQTAPPVHNRTMMNMLSGRDAPPAVWSQGGNGGNNLQFGNYFQSGSFGKQAADVMPNNTFNCNSFDKSLSFAMHNGVDPSCMMSLNSIGNADNLAQGSKQNSFCQENPFAGDWETVNEKRSQMAMMGRQPSASQGFGAFNVGFAGANHGANVQWN